MGKKNYNPLKMIGTYVGGFLLIILFSFLFGKSYISWSLNLLGEPGYWMSSTFLLVFFIIPYALFNLGALIGYGIHSFIRRFKK
jgi:hypothetical protein